MRTVLILAIILLMAGTGQAFAKVVKRFYPDGKMQAAVGYNEKNQLHGPYKFYWPNGRLKEKGKNKNGRPVGTPRRYSINGVLQER